MLSSACRSALVALCALALGSVASAQPANDDCATATTIPTLVQGSPYVSAVINHAAAGNDAFDATCDGAGNGASANRGVWFRYVNGSSHTTAVFFETQSADSVLSVWTGDCSMLTQVACNAAAIDITPGWIFQMAPSTTYYFLLARELDTVPGVDTNYQLQVTRLNPPANDLCANATNIPVPGSSFTNTLDPRGATPDIALTGCAVTGSTETRAGVWYRLAPAAGDDYNLVLGETGSADTIIGVFTGSCGSLTQVFCTQTDASNSFIARGGQVYYMLIGLQSATAQPTAAYTASVVINTATSACCVGSNCSVISRSACTTAGGTWRGAPSVACNTNLCAAPPANDNCANAIAITTPFSASVADAISARDDVAASCVRGFVADAERRTRYGVWYSYTTPAEPTRVTLTESSASDDTLFAVFTGSCGSLTQVACIDATTTDTGSFDATPGQTYFILLGMGSATTAPSSGGYSVSIDGVPSIGACCASGGCTLTGKLACDALQGVWGGPGAVCEGGPNASEIIDPAATVPDATNPGIGELIRTVSAGGTGTVTTIAVTVDVNMIFVGDWRIRLIAPNGATATIMDRPGGTAGAPVCIADFGIANGNDMVGVFTFVDSAPQGFNEAALSNVVIPPGSYRAQGCDNTLVDLNATFAGAPAAGTWTLEITDRDEAITGTIAGWSLTINGGTMPPCEQIGACCTNGVCTLTAGAAGCPGTFQSAGSTCTPSPCGAPATIVCCRGTTCALIAAASCTAPAGVGVGPLAGSSCNGSGANTSPCCYADFDKSGARNLDDIFVYINAWFSPTTNPYCKIGGNGTAAANLDDLFIFINVWFAGGCG